MAYDTIERSAEGRKPVELYTFLRDYQAFRYTSADRNITFGGAEFKARPISRGRIEVSNETARSGLEVTAPRDLPVADMFRVSPPTIPVTMLLQQFHHGDNEAVVVWSGRIVTVDFQGTVARIKLEPSYTSVRRVGLRRMYATQCPHVLYGTACRVNREDFKLEAPVDSVSGVTVSIGAVGVRPNGYYDGGFIEYPVELGIIERRFVLSHVGTTLTLSAQPYRLAVGAGCKVYPGCDHTTGSNGCGKFGNLPNYGGFPFFTKKNPFGGEPIY